MKVILCGYKTDFYRYEAIYIAFSRISEVVDMRYTKNNPIRMFVTFLKAVFIKSDKVFVTSGNYLLVILLGMTKKFHHKEVIFDLFTSPYLKFGKKWHYYLERLVLKLIDKGFAVSQGYKDYWNSDKVCVVSDSVPDEWIDKKNGSFSNRNIACYFGMNYTHHGVGMILRAAERLPEYSFFFCGHQLEPSLPNVIPMGWIPDSALMKIVDLSKVCFGNLISETDTELAPSNKELYAMARNKPVITVKDRVDVDKLVELIKDPPECEGKNYIRKNHSLNKVIEQILSGIKL